VPGGRDSDIALREGRLTEQLSDRFRYRWIGPFSLRTWPLFDGRPSASVGW